MSSHEQFEELCAMAAVGDISLAESQVLTAHVETCVSCRKTLTDMKDIHATWLPELEAFEIKRSFAVESRLRQLILKRVIEEGASFSDEAQLPVPAVSHPLLFSQRRLIRAALAVAAVVLVVLASIAVGTRLGSGRLDSRHSIGTNDVARGIDHPFGPENASSRDALQGNSHQTQVTQAKLEIALAEAQSDRGRLERQLEEAELRATASDRSKTAESQEVSSLHSQLDSARASESNTSQQLASLRASSSAKETELTLLESENRDLRDKLNQLTTSVERERDLMTAGREIRDLIAARNLHIIDVYDTSGQGQTQKSFGRVFYTEGKSLVFYAYDLPPRRIESAKYAFYAWGKKDGSGEVKIRNLGIFYNDDQAQRRWILKINDPQVLSEIDSVFVTLEKTDGQGSAPTGKKLLTAYLGSPANHP